MFEPDLFGEVDADHPLRVPSPEPLLNTTPGRPLVVAYGMGLNSTALLCGLRKVGIRPDLILAADTGGEKPETYAYLDVMGAWLARQGFPPITVVRNDGIHGTLEQECLTNHVLPSKVYGYSGCSDKYKIRPQNKYLKTWPDAMAAWANGGKVWRAIGYDADEPHRAKVHEDKQFRYWYPLIVWGWGREDCAREIAAAGLPIPPKSACFFCPSMKKREVAALKRDHPELFARAVAMERNAAGYNEQVQGLGRHWSWEGLMSLPLIDRDRLSEPPDISCTCDDGDPEGDD